MKKMLTDFDQFLAQRLPGCETSGNAWRTLQSVIDQSICIKNNEDSTALFAILSLGMTLSHMNAETTSTKMIASAIKTGCDTRLA